MDTREERPCPYSFLVVEFLDYSRLAFDLSISYFLDCTYTYDVNFSFFRWVVAKIKLYETGSWL